MTIRITGGMLENSLLIEGDFDEDDPRLRESEVIEILDAWTSVDRSSDGSAAAWEVFGVNIVIALWDAGELTVESWTRAPDGFWHIADWPFDFDVEVYTDPVFDFEAPEYLRGLELVERLNSTVAELGRVEWPRLREGGDDPLYCPHCEMPAAPYSLTTVDLRRQYRSGSGISGKRLVLSTLISTSETRSFIKHSCGKPVQLPEGWVMV